MRRAEGLVGSGTGLEMIELPEGPAAIARRRFDLRKVGKVESILVELGPAHTDPADVHTVRCSVTVGRESGSTVRYAYGADSVQALLNGLYLMRTEAETLKAEGLVECDGENWTGVWWPNDHATEPEEAR